ncbi:Serine/threonine-protein kinase KIN4 [Zancudomyces culisetae]|uniref:Serine/threonine-protein kinase KIN4 n=1 Tax=Zancudomyces culisetae TaxID=1213189 RepID=A0A1R1PPA4_ZANCU|nr:Serine/threonine-protein kinase KIN4 [Zancudomyces culisetae]|eukprot:OMH82788.1 Serine/threonine-protein kinase KIN4 [Zancudomyces culisetae]
MDDARVPTNNSGKSGRKIKAKPKSNFFGPYVLLQTIGEGEFAKVKLGLHKETREDAAIKMIKKEWINSDVKLAKITREISALKVSRNCWENYIYLL